MADILLDFPINASQERVYRAISMPEGLDTWWTLAAAGVPEADAIYTLDFGPGYTWEARVVCHEPDSIFELEMTKASLDWVGTRIGFTLEPRGEATWVQFGHRGWAGASAHYRTSCMCWAMYLRILRRALEYGEVVAYSERLDA